MLFDVVVTELVPSQARDVHIVFVGTEPSSKIYQKNGAAPGSSSKPLKQRCTIKQLGGAKLFPMSSKELGTAELSPKRSKNLSVLGRIELY